MIRTLAIILALIIWAALGPCFTLAFCLIALLLLQSFVRTN